MTAACPKRMAYGPCGGVRDDGRCEVGHARCAFVDAPVTAWAGGAASGSAGDPRAAGGSAGDAPGPADAPRPVTGARELVELAARRPLVVCDLAAAPLRADGLRAAAHAVAGCVDAALLGDAPWARVQLPPSLRAALVGGEGVRAWAGLTCRDRNAVALEGELAGLVAAGAAAVHCVTGDHPALGHRGDATGVFELDSTRLAALAATTGLLVSVAESPSAPPVAARPARLGAKVAAGARVCFVNHGRDLGAVADFVAAVRAAAGGDRLLLLGCVGLATTPAGVAGLARFSPGATPPPSAAAALHAADPVGAGIRAAVAAATELLEACDLDGVDLSAPSAPGEELETAGALALAARELGGGT